LELPITLKAKQIPLKEMLTSYKYEEVRGYCSNCSNYKKNYSCPDFKFNTPDYLELYKHATVIMTQVDTDLIKEHSAAFKDQVYSSRVYTNYINHHEEVPYDWISAMSMYAFNEVKDILSDRLLLIEDNFSNSISLPPGSCTRCKTCLKQLGKACAEPDKLRYSLEALGFLVSDIYKQVFGIELGWTEKELPASFNSCSVFLSKEPIDVEQVISLIGELKLKL